MLKGVWTLKHTSLLLSRNYYVVPSAKGIDVDVPKCLSAAVKILSLSGQTLKLDLVIVVDLLPHTLHLDAGVKAEETANTVFPL